MCTQRIERRTVVRDCRRHRLGFRQLCSQIAPVPALLLELSARRYDLFNLTLRGSCRRDEGVDAVLDVRKRHGPVLQVLNPRFESPSAGRCGCCYDHTFQNLAGFRQRGTSGGKLVERCKRISFPVGRLDESF